MNRLYETVFVLKPSLPDEDVDKVITTMENVVKERGAAVKTDRWGKRRLAFEVHKEKEGNYILFTIETADAGAVHELERRLRIDDKVIRYLSVRIDEERQRAIKLSKVRGVPPPWERAPLVLAPDVVPVPGIPSEEETPGEEEEV